MEHNTKKYSELLEGRLPTSTLEFELCDKLIKANQENKELREFVTHKMSCKKMKSRTLDLGSLCTCGLEQALKKPISTDENLKKGMFEASKKALKKKPLYKCPSDGECTYPNCGCEWNL